MMLQLLQRSPGQYVITVLVIVVSIVLHELAHGFAAIRLGDRTPIETGHMTLNPLVHMGWVSLILLAIVGIAWGQMPVTPSRLRGKYGGLWVAAAGPAMNVALAGVAVVAMGILVRLGVFNGDSQVAANGWLVLWKLGTINLALALLNLLPIPPLDGSRMLFSLSPGYRKLVSGDAARGFMTAMTFALFFGAAQYIYDAADYLALHGVLLVTGHV